MSSFDRIKPPKQRPDLFSRREPSPPSPFPEDDDVSGDEPLGTGGPSRQAAARLDASTAELAQEEHDTGLLTVECGHCGDVCPMTLTAALSRALPMAVVLPWRRHPVFALCPCGQRRAWLKPRVSIPGR